MPAKTEPVGRYRMSGEHKAQLALGREQSRIIRDYLTTVAANRPRRGRKRTSESVEKRLVQVLEALNVEDDPIRRLRLIAERERLEREKNRFQASEEDVSGLEREFVEVAGDYSARKGISYQAWRELGVPTNVLREAGILREGVMQRSA